MKTIFFIISMFPFLLSAHDLKMKNYLKMQESLAADDFKTALSAHLEICDKELGHYKDTYKDCSKSFKEIKEIRESFKSLSTLFMNHAEKPELKGLIVAECPMANAKWIQRSGDLRNPYYGKSMLECGSKVSTY